MYVTVGVHIQPASYLLACRRFATRTMMTIKQLQPLWKGNTRQSSGKNPDREAPQFSLRPKASVQQAREIKGKQQSDPRKNDWRILVFAYSKSSAGIL